MWGQQSLQITLWNQFDVPFFTYVSCVRWVSICKFIEKVEMRGWKGREEKEILIIAYTPHDSESNYQGTFSEILIKQKEIELHTLLLTYKLYSSIKVSLHA